jgi:hypothetical protein
MEFMSVLVRGWASSGAEFERHAAPTLVIRRSRRSIIARIRRMRGLECWWTSRQDNVEWRQVSFLILLILIAVAAIDFVSGRLRAAMAGRKSAPG